MQAGGNVNLIATGGGEDSNSWRGSDLKAGNNLLLSADHDITLEAAQGQLRAAQHQQEHSAGDRRGGDVRRGRLCGRCHRQRQRPRARPMAGHHPNATAICLQATPPRSSAATTPP
uniref:hemagglutinin repeat-containing protein n=1 Tax=Xanthomonas oryzae TaxID=347 RepID=UPI003DA09A2E